MKTFGSSKDFVLDSDLDWEIVNEGMKRKIMTYDDSIMLVKVQFDQGAIGYRHEHYHSQVTYVVSGEFEFSIGDETRIVKGGDAVYMAPHIPHGAVCKKAGILIDVFSPIREDFMEK
ncbi:MAG: cupin domain-containing protein [Bergeyella sp.]